MPAEGTFYRRLIKLTIICSFSLSIVLSITVALVKNDSTVRTFLAVILALCVFLSLSGIGVLILFRQRLNDEGSRLQRRPRVGSPRSNRRPNGIYTISRPERGRFNQGADLEYEAPPSYEEAAHNSHHSSIDFQSVTMYAACISSDEVEEEEEVKAMEDLSSLSSEDVPSAINISIIQGSSSSNDYVRNEVEGHNSIREESIAGTSSSFSDSLARCSVSNEDVSVKVEEQDTNDEQKQTASPPPYPGEPEALKQMRAHKRY